MKYLFVYVEEENKGEEKEKRGKGSGDKINLGARSMGIVHIGYMVYLQFHRQLPLWSADG